MGEGEGKLEAGLLPFGKSACFLFRIQIEAFAELKKKAVVIFTVCGAEVSAVCGDA